MSAKRKRIFGLLALVSAGLLLANDAAAAALVETPLRLQCSVERPDVGDDVVFRIDAPNDTHARKWAGARVLLRYSYDANERAAGDGADDPERPASNAGWTERPIGELTLGGKASAFVDWTVPEEARDHNLIVTVASLDGETLATLHLPVGDAPPVQLTTGGGDGREPAEGSTADGHPYGNDAVRKVPAPAFVALVGLVVSAAILGLALRRLR